MKIESTSRLRIDQFIRASELIDSPESCSDSAKAKTERMPTVDANFEAILRVSYNSDTLYIEVRPNAVYDDIRLSLYWISLLRL